MGHAYEPEANYDTALGRFRNLEFKSSESPQFEITRNNILYDEVFVYNTFDISIHLNLEKNTESQWSNIFAFQKAPKINDEGKDVNAIEVFSNGYPESITSLIPAVLLRPNSNAMHICMPLNDAKSCWDSPEMPIDTWFKLNIRQTYDHVHKEYVYQISINDEVKRTVINNQPEIFGGVNGIIGSSYNPKFNYKTAAGQYKDFGFTSQFFRPKPPAGFEIGSNSITPGLSCSGNGNLGRIVGGDIAKKGSWPWFVRLDISINEGPHKGKGTVCGGTLLSNTRILARLYKFKLRFSMFSLVV